MVTTGTYVREEDYQGNIPQTRNNELGVASPKYSIHQDNIGIQTLTHRFQLSILLIVLSTCPTAPYSDLHRYYSITCHIPQYTLPVTGGSKQFMLYFGIKAHRLHKRSIGSKAANCILQIVHDVLCTKGT